MVLLCWVSFFKHVALRSWTLPRLSTCYPTTVNASSLYWYCPNITTHGTQNKGFMRSIGFVISVASFRGLLKEKITPKCWFIHRTILAQPPLLFRGQSGVRTQTSSVLFCNTGDTSIFFFFFPFLFYNTMGSHWGYSPGTLSSQKDPYLLPLSFFFTGRQTERKEVCSYKD